MPKRTRIEQRMIRRRLTGRMVSPCLNLEGRRFAVTTRYAVPGTHWATGHHTGEDYACPVGSLAVAVSWGTVIAVGITSWGPAYGQMVVIRTGDNSHDYAYCHLSSTSVAVGDKVRPGAVVGRTGATGNVTGPHLHFEARPAGGRYGSDVPPMRVKRAIGTHLVRKS